MSGWSHDYDFPGEAPAVLDVLVKERRYRVALTPPPFGKLEADVRRIAEDQIRAHAIEDAFAHINPIRLRRAIMWAEDTNEMVESMEKLGHTISDALKLKWTSDWGAEVDYIQGEDRRLLGRLQNLVYDAVQISRKRAEEIWKLGGGR